MSALSDEIRRSFGAADAKRDAGLTTPQNIQRYDNISYGPDRTFQLLDVYKLKARASMKMPVIINVHGGAWVYGSKEIYQFYCMSLASMGFAVVNFSYRLAPEYKFPAPLEDMNLVCQWILDHALEYGFDTENIFAVGDSAGAHILSLYCSFLTDKTYADTFSFKAPNGFKLKAVALNCGAYRIEKAETDTMDDFLENHGTPEELERINVLSHINPDFPEVFVMTCTGDFLLDQALMIIKTLMDNKVKHEFHFYGDKNTELGHVFHCNIRSGEAAACNRDECEFFKSLI